MTTPFSETFRSLHADVYKLSIVGLCVAIILALLWGYWFFTTKITIYETSKRIEITDIEKITSSFERTKRSVARTRADRKRLIVAYFTPEAIESIKPGQHAWVYLEGKVGKITGAISAEVKKCEHGSEQREQQVIIEAVIDADKPNPFKAGVKGLVQVEVDYVTPAALTLKASGMLDESNPTH